MDDKTGEEPADKEVDELFNGPKNGQSPGGARGQNLGGKGSKKGGGFGSSYAPESLVARYGLKGPYDEAGEAQVRYEARRPGAAAATLFGGRKINADQ